MDIRWIYSGSQLLYTSKKRMTSADLLRGYHLPGFTKFGPPGQSEALQYCHANESLMISLSLEYIKNTLYDQ